MCKLVNKFFTIVWFIGMSPPFVDPDVGGTREPGVQDEDASESGGSLEAGEQAGVVVQPQALPEPVHAVLGPRGGRRQQGRRRGQERRCSRT